MAISRNDGAFEVFVYDPVVKRKRYVGRFPTREAAQEVEALAKRGEYKPHVHGLEWSLARKGEDLCRRCGGTADHLHHLVPQASGDSPCPMRGGLPLCRKCHKGWHHRGVTIFRDHLLPEEVAFVASTMGEAWLNASYPAQQQPPEIDSELLAEVVALRLANHRLHRQLKQARKDANGV